MLVRSFVRLLICWLVSLPSLSLCVTLFLCARCRVLFISFMFPVSNLNNLNDLHCCFNKLFDAPVLPIQYVCVQYVMLLLPCVYTSRATTYTQPATPPGKPDFIWGCRSKYANTFNRQKKRRRRKHGSGKTRP